MSKNEVLLQKDITESVISKIEELKTHGLILPNDYAPQNALKSAFFELTNSSNGNLLEKCTKSSIANALLNMVIQGLNPSKKQNYFIAYGTNCQLVRSYFGTQTVIRRLPTIKEVWANVIYEGDTVETAIIDGKETLINHDTNWLNRDNEIIGAYCIIEKTDGEKDFTIMTKKEIDISWSKAKTKAVQKDFPQEMAKRTVINRACKNLINTSVDNDKLIQSFNETTQNEYVEDETLEDKKNNLSEEIENQEYEIIDVEEIEVKEVENTQNQEETY